MHSRATSLVVALVLAYAGAQGRAQGVDTSRTFTSLASTVPQVAPDGQVLELRVHWTAAPINGQATGAARPADTLVLTAQTLSSGFLRRERRPQLSADMLVLVVRAADGRELDWRTARNPRILRAETPQPDGRLTGQFFELTDVDLFVAIPRLLDASAVRIYQPRWTGTEYALDIVGDVGLTPQP